jgi:hypothetical protein
MQAQASTLLGLNKVSVRNWRQIDLQKPPRSLIFVLERSSRTGFVERRESWAASTLRGGLASGVQPLLARRQFTSARPKGLLPYA